MKLTHSVRVDYGMRVIWLGPLLEADAWRIVQTLLVAGADATLWCGATQIKVV